MKSLLPVLRNCAHLALFASALAWPSLAGAETISLTTVVDVRQADYEWGRPVLDRSVRAERLRIGGREFTSGIGTQVNSTLAVALAGSATRLTALAGVDDATEAKVPVRFRIVADGSVLWDRVLQPGAPAVPVEVDLTGRRQLLLETEDVGNALSQACAGWVDAKLELTDGAPKPKAERPPVFAEEAVVLTPPAPAEPRVNGPRVFGVRPGHPFLFTIPATGEAPLRYAADNLPAGLTLDAATGRITGRIEKPGTHLVTLRATNARGTDAKPLRIEVGERLSLTPPLGWNSWNCWGEAVDQEKVLSSARAMAEKGLIAHGWSYINIDDAWQTQRGGPHHAIQPNEKFPDMKGLCDAIHAMGLKVGIYSTPWVTSYAIFPGGSAETPEGKWAKPTIPKTVNRKIMPWAIGRHSFATNDAKQWAEWGIDYLKYDWHPNEVPETAEMASALRISGRDIIYSLSNAAPFQYAGELSHLANAWRTTGDIRDYWGSIMRIGFTQEKWRPYAGPGHWNDPDMLVVGLVGWGPNLHPSRLTPNEQYLHLSLWSLLSSPLLIGCDLARLDAFTLGLLTNDEVLAINQDELGRQAAQVINDGRRQIWVKELADGSRAIGYFNLAGAAQPIGATWAQLGLTKPERVRDVWRQRDLDTATMAEGFSPEVARHGSVLIRVWPAR